MESEVRAPLFITNEQVENALNWDKIIDAVSSALKRVDSTQNRDDVIMPLRTRLTAPTKSILLTMPCYLREENIYCIKILTASNANRALNLPTHCAMIELFDGSTGQHLATFAGEAITKQRTAAASAVATKLLISDVPQVMAILGAGDQAKSHFQVFHHLYPKCEVRIWSPREETGRRLVDFISSVAVEKKVIWCATVAEAVKDADLICTVTDATEPILNKEWVKPGAHINAVGACVPAKQEIHSDLMNSATVYVDSLVSAKAESGDILRSGAKIFGEIGEILNDKKVAMKQHTTIFKSLGVAIEDAVTAHLVYNIYTNSTN